MEHLLSTVKCTQLRTVLKATLADLYKMRLLVFETSFSFPSDNHKSTQTPVGLFFFLMQASTEKVTTLTYFTCKHTFMN